MMPRLEIDVFAGWGASAAGPRVLQVIPELETGGAERTAVDVSLALKAAGGHPLVASAGGRLVAELDAAGIEHITLPLASKSPLTMLGNAAKLSALVRRRDIDILHARSRAPAWSALLSARSTGCGFVTTYHGSYNQKNALKGLYNSVMARGDITIANSHYIADLIEARHGARGDRLAVIHRGSDLAALQSSAVSEERKKALREAWGLPEGASILLNVARLTAWKGQKVILKALADLAKNAPALFGPHVDRYMVFAGDDQGRVTYKQELEDLAQDLGLAGVVRFVGHVDDVPAALALSEVSLVASVEPEAFGRAAIEAQAAGVPVIVSDLGAVKETVLAPPEAPQREATGWRVPVGDETALARTIREALSLPEAERHALQDRARRHVLARFSLDQMTSKTLQVYREVLERQGKG